MSIKTREIPQIKIGQYWKASSTEEDNYTKWLFYITLKSNKKGKLYYLGVKCNYISKKPIIDFKSVPEFEDQAQAWWFDSGGKGPDLFYLSELIK